MTWATPGVAALVAAIIIPPLILLYFLKLRRRETTIPSTLLWKQAVQDMQANAPFQRLRMSLLLFLQLLALLFLMLALAQPEWEGEAAAASKTILLIDRSASMSAVEDGRSRLDRAKSDAIDFINGLRSGGIFSPSGEAQEVMIIGFSDEAQVYSSFSSSKAQLVEAVESIEPTHESTLIGQALELARAHTISTDPEGQGMEIRSRSPLLIFSDGRIHDLNEQVAKEEVQYRRVGESDHNVGFVAFDARRTYVDQNTIDLYARLANWGTEPVATSVFLSAGDQLLRTTTVTIPPGYSSDPKSAEALAGAAADEDEPGVAGPAAAQAVWRPGMTEVRFNLLQPHGITLGVNIEHDDALAADNLAFVVVPPAKMLHIGVVTRSDTFPIFQTVLEGLPNVDRIDVMSPEGYAIRATTAAIEDYDVIVLDDVQIESLGPGRYLSFGAVPPLEGFSTGEVVNGDRVVAADDDHPVNQYVNYNTLFIGEHETLVAPETATAIVEASAGPLMVETVQGNVRAIVSSVPALNTNWIVDPSFVPLMQNAVEYLGSVGEALTESSLRPGDAIVARLPSNAIEIDLLTPDSNAEPIRLTPADPARTSWGPTRLAGLYRLTWSVPESDEEFSRDFAVNLYDEAEGAIEPVKSIQFGRDEVEVVAGEGRLRKKPLWPWAILLALLCVLVEWWVYGRRSYI